MREISFSSTLTRIDPFSHAPKLSSRADPDNQDSRSGATFMSLPLRAASHSVVFAVSMGVAL